MLWVVCLLKLMVGDRFLTQPTIDIASFVLANSVIL